MPTVTGLRVRKAGRVAVELDGRPWRVVPVEAALTAGLDVGQELDRQRARLLRRELVRLRTVGAASSTLRRQDLSATKLAERLEQVGGPPRERRQVVEMLERVGVVDDVRVAVARATSLAERGYGNAAIDADLESKGIAAAIRAEAIQALPPELERLGPIVERRGIGPRTARFAARRGFGEEAVAAAAGVGFANDT
jgi:SOS response regulatory protein OraA/RecX